MASTPAPRDPVDDELGRIGDRVRRWREEAKLTLQELASRSGVATSTIQKIETAQMVPSIAVMLKVARGLGRRPAELLGDDGDAPGVIHLRAGERHPVGVPGRVVVERISGDLFDPALETWRVSVHPGAGSGRDAIRYDGEELVLCEKGPIVFVVGDQEYRLRSGDSLHFKASAPHFFRNDGENEARFLITGTTPHRFRAAMQGRVATKSRRDRSAPRSTR